MAFALGRVGGEKARNLLLDQLVEEKDADTRKAIHDALKQHYAGDPTATKALKESASPLPSKAADEF